MGQARTWVCRGATVVLLVGLCVAAGFSCKGRSSGAAGTVVLYCSVDQAVAEPIVAEFEKQTGIRVLARYDTEAAKTVGLVQRIRTEAAAPVADVFWSGEIFHTIRLAREGLLAPWESEAFNDWPDPFKAADRTWYGLGLRGRVIAYHTGRVSGDEAPRSLEALLDEKWSGRIVMAAPEFGTTGGDVASWFVHYGPRRATEILRGLAANRVRLVAGNSTAVRMVATGQADVCMTDTDDVYAAQRNNWPVACHGLDQAGKGSLAIPNTAAVLKGAPHPEQASALMTFILGGTVEEMLARSDSHNGPVQADLSEEFAQYAIQPALSVDYEDVADMLPQAIATAMEILR